MAVGKKSMARAAESAKAEKNTDLKEVTKSVISNDAGQPESIIIYGSCHQVLDREALPNEGFGIGDDMPIYYY